MSVDSKITGLGDAVTSRALKAMHAMRFYVALATIYVMMSVLAKISEYRYIYPRITG